MVKRACDGAARGLHDAILPWPIWQAERLDPKLQHLVPLLDQAILLRVEDGSHQWDDPILLKEQLELYGGKLWTIVHHDLVHI